jgi:WD40 repeat protein
MRRNGKLVKYILFWIFIFNLIFLNGVALFISNGMGMIGEEIDNNGKVRKYTAGSDIGAVEISSDGQYFIAKGDNMFYYFNRSNQTPLWNYTSGASGNNIRSFSISSDGEYVVTGSDTMWICLFNNDNSTPLWHYVESSFSPYSVAISADGKYIAAGIGNGSSADGSIRYGKVCLFNRSDPVPLWTYTIEEWILSVAISSNGQYIAAGGLDNKVYFFDRANSTPLWSYETGGRVTSIEISSDGQYIVAGTYENKIYLFNNTSNSPLWSYSAGNGWKRLAISSDGQLIVVSGYMNGTTNGIVYLFNYTSGVPQWVYTKGEYSKAVAISSDGQYIVIGHFNGEVSLLCNTSKYPLWDYRVGQTLGGMTISSNGMYIAAESENIIYLIPTSYKPPSYDDLIMIMIIGGMVFAVLAGFVFLYILYYSINKRALSTEN